MQKTLLIAGGVIAVGVIGYMLYESRDRSTERNYLIAWGPEYTDGFNSMSGDELDFTYYFVSTYIVGGLPVPPADFATWQVVGGKYGIT